MYKKKKSIIWTSDIVQSSYHPLCYPRSISNIVNVNQNHNMDCRWWLEGPYGFNLLQFTNLLKNRYLNIIGRKAICLFLKVFRCFISRWRIYFSVYLLLTIFIYDKNFVSISNFDLSISLRQIFAGLTKIITPYVL